MHRLIVVGCAAALLLGLAGSAAGRKYRARTAEESASVGRLTRGALGIDERRGDKLYVVTLPFASRRLRLEAEQKRKQEARRVLLNQVLVNLAKGVAVVLGLLVLRAVVNAIGAGVQREEEIVMRAQREIEAPVEEAVPETAHDILLSRIARLIAEQPEDASRLIRTMLIEDRGART